MVPKNRQRQHPVVVEETATASMVSKRQLADELGKVSDDPDEEINPFG